MYSWYVFPAFFHRSRFLIPRLLGRYGSRVQNLYDASGYQIVFELHRTLLLLNTAFCSLKVIVISWSAFEVFL